MILTHANTLRQVAKLLACALIVKITAGVILDYRHYLPPNFESGFLHGRQGYFYSGYHGAFYLHIASGPCTLVLGALLMSERFRRRYATWHRNLGKLQIACVLLAVAPSGLWMAMYAQTGAVAGLGFAALGVATGITAWRGWISATAGNFIAHRRWMTRCYLLLCSAVILRLIGGAFTVAGFDGAWTYSLAAWISWLAPLLAFELSTKSLNPEPAATAIDAHNV